MKKQRTQCRQFKKLSVSIICILIFSSCNLYVCKIPHVKFRNVLTSKEFKSQANKGFKQLKPITELETSSLPLYGTIIVKQPPRNSQAGKHGMKIGDIITAIDQTELIYQWSPWGRKTVPQTLHYVTSKGESKSFTIQPGIVGIRNVSYRRPDLWYIRHGQRNSKWDQYVLVALATQMSNPDLAETAWFYAFKEGYKEDVLSIWSSVFIAYYQGAPSLAWSRLKQLKKMKSKPPLILFPHEEYSIALANGNIADMYSILEKYSSLSNAIIFHTINDIKGLMQQVKHSPMPKLPPTQQAENMKRVDIIQQSIALDSNYVSYNRFASFKEGTPFRFKQSVGYFKDIYFGTKEPLHNAELKTTFTIKKMPGESRFANVFVVGMVDKNSDSISQGPFPGLPELMVYFECSGCNLPNSNALWIGYSKLNKSFATSAPKMKFDGKQIHTLRMIKVDNAGEIFLDGRRIAYVPLLPNSELSFFLKTVGTDVKIKTFNIWKLSKGK